MTGIADAAPRSPEAWKNMGCCADFPQPWADLMWGLEFEDKHPLARVFRQAGASVCEHDCPVRAECLAYAGAAGLEWGLYGGRLFLVKSVFRVSSLIFFGFRHEECRPVVCFTGCPSCRT
ncbi:WhiB family transcriptional regulator [Bifidobacterium longum]|uniref:WhiB family transcriptional regulator n=1 Tax=Bifidobacterium longum TaxID=216816 RepID=UPI003B9DAD18